MSVKEIIDKIKLFLADEVVAPEIEQKFTDVKTTDGIILSFTGKLSEGIDIFTVDETGKNPAPDGDYMLEDGTKITVSGGKIDKLVQEKPIETPAAPAAPAAPAIGATLSLEELDAKISKLQEENQQLAEIVKQLAESFSKQNFKEEVKMSIKKEEVPDLRKTDAPMNKKNSELSNIFRNMYK